MHTEALAFAANHAGGEAVWSRTLEVGSRDINGSVRPLIHTSQYVGLDIAPGPGVDVIADGARLPFPEQTFDLVLMLEVLEHTPAWFALVKEAQRVLRSPGRLVVTTACDPREPHSGVDGNSVRPGEHYGNIPPLELLGSAHPLKVESFSVLEHRGDVRIVVAK